MKAVATWFLISALLFGLVGCARDVEEQAPEESPVVTTQESGAATTTPEVPPFSYETVRTQFGANTPGVKTGGFRNVTQCLIRSEADAAERAKNECTVEYDTVRVRYDSAADVWEVCFLPNHPGGGQDVYLNSEGVTQLIIYGE